MQRKWCMPLVTVGQLPVAGCQFSVLSSQFSVLSSQFSVLSTTLVGGVIAGNWQLGTPSKGQPA